MTKPAIVDKTDLLESLLAERILVLDGAMGTQIQALGLDERAVRGERFADHHKDLKNFADILCLTQPDDDHARSTASTSRPGPTSSRRTRSAPARVGMEEFDLPLELVREINRAAVALCPRGPRDEFNERTPDQPRFVAGSIGPTTKQTAISTQVDDASYRGVTFDADGRLVLRAGGGAGRSGRRHSAAGDGDRHAQPQGVPVRDREVLRRARASACR